MPADDKAVLIYTTYPSAAEAEEAGAALVTSGLAACVNVVPGMTSIYAWQGRLERRAESIMVIKTRSALADEAAGAVRVRHSYENPAILVIPVTGGSPDFLAWIADSAPGAAPVKSP
jgi:periplasmic divalent cation tolerance protein